MFVVNLAVFVWLAIILNLSLSTLRILLKELVCLLNALHTEHILPTVVLFSPKHHDEQCFPEKENHVCCQSCCSSHSLVFSTMYTIEKKYANWFGHRKYQLPTVLLL